MDQPKDLAATETRPSMPPDVRISVANFGPIADGTIDLRPLTVFVGPSNTGKTYFAILIYSTTEGRQGDYVFFFMDAAKNALVTVPMELKSGAVDASKAHEQLQQAATYAENLVKKGSKTICHPILVHGGSVHPKQRKTLNRAKIRFHDHQLTIKTARCDRPRNLALAVQA